MRSLIILLAILSILLISPVQNRARAQSSPPVLAFYYAWFDETTWTSGQAADTPSPTYRSADPAAIERHVAQAKGAGIDAFVQAWYGPRVDNNQTETNFRLLLDTAAAYQFQAAVDVEVTGPFFPDRNAVQAGLATLFATHIHHPAYLKFQNKPVIFFWRQQRFDVAEWASIRAAVDPHRTTYWIAEGIDLAYQDVFDGHHLYSIAWASNPQAELNKWPPRIKKVEDRLDTDKLWIATTMPGYNDLKLPRSNAFARARQNGTYYRETWAAAEATNPDMILITSFNEHLEGTAIEPSVTYGDFYLDLTRELTGYTGPLLPNPSPSPDESASATLSTTPAIEAAVDLISTAEGQQYRVQAGDTIYGLAQSFGVSMQAIIEANALTEPDRLALDQLLLIPISGDESSVVDTVQGSDQDVVEEPISYIVQPNDTLYDIAAEFEVTVAAIVELNQIVDPAFIDVGQVLEIPKSD